MTQTSAKQANKIHPSVKIGKYCIIAEDVEIGKNTVINDFVELRAGVRIGKDCYIDSRVTMTGSCEIGDYVIVRNACIIARGSKVGDYTFLAPQVMFNNLDSKRKKIGGAHIGKKCFIGTNTTLHHGIKISDNVTVGAKSFVNKNLTPGAYVGSPVKKIYYE